ncbi:hypothetical protein C9F11_42930 (plasmid) [Streptomyces sp. YIM 121038]|uniref:hypothetical protein n=1 Tax=Streptomyces sp. YIM 121038 TaxID=2136401 RepID=UPI0011109951|nr:hypothetical protein [Streptomyces sp. YIM 121038]QCX82166.1 hypothetical protein C9F11_42930 [Streptomyces sp. YIM 121038]
MPSTDNTTSYLRKRGFHSGRLRRPATCQLAIAAELLAEHGYPDQHAAHQDGMCARLYSLGRRANRVRSEAPSPPLDGPLANEDDLDRVLFELAEAEDRQDPHDTQ